MPKYAVHVEYTLAKHIIVEAPTEDDALHAVDDLNDGFDIVLTDTDYLDGSWNSHIIQEADDATETDYVYMK